MRKTIANLLAVSLLILFVVISGPLLVVQDPLHDADAIVVIGGDHKPERVKEAIELFKQGYAPVVIISAGTRVVEGGKEMPEAEVMRKQALSLGLVEDAIVMEVKSQSTYENAAYTYSILQERGYHSILLVTSAYHSSRAKRIFEDAYGSAVSIAVEPGEQAFCPPCFAIFPDQAYVVAYEYWNWVQYLVNSKHNQKQDEKNLAF